MDTEEVVAAMVKEVRSIYDNKFRRIERSIDWLNKQVDSLKTGKIYKNKDGVYECPLCGHQWEEG